MDAPAFDRFIQTGRECVVPIVKQKLVILIARRDLRSAIIAECGCGGAESAQDVGSCAIPAVKSAGK